jgi:Tol biopolymer transport system component
MSNSRKGRTVPTRAEPAKAARAGTPAPTQSQSRQIGAASARARTARQSNSYIRPLLLAGAVIVVLLVGWLLYSAIKPFQVTVVPSELGRISFVRQNSDNSTDLYVVNPDGSGQQKALSGTVIQGVTEWSPDGKQMLIQAAVNGVSTVVRVDIGPDNKSANGVQLTADIKVDSVLPAWSPDGSMVAFQSKRDGGDYQVFVMDKDGNGKKRLSDGKGYAGQPEWSPDGQSVVYTAGDKQSGSTHDLYVVPVDGGTPKKLTPGGKDLSSPRWSPDGKYIVYLDNAGDRNNTVMIMNADGTGAKELVTQGFNKGVEFSPDGSKIVYYSIAPPNGSDVFILPIAGGATSNLTHLSAEDYDPTWSPNGKQLAWAGRSGQDFKIMVGDADGNNQKTVSTGDGSDSQPRWGAPVK